MEKYNGLIQGYKEVIRLGGFKKSFITELQDHRNYIEECKDTLMEVIFSLQTISTLPATRILLSHSSPLALLQFV